MITKDNIKELVQTISTDTLHDAINSPCDYILFWAHTFNAGSFATIEAMHYNEQTEQEANDNGQLFCDKDTFLQLLNETEALEY
jgi:hypothetical protein